MRGIGRIGSRARQRPMYLRMLAGILLSYALIIGFGGTTIGDPVRIALFGWLLWTALRLHGLARYRWLSLAGTAAVVVLTAVTIQVGAPRIAAGVVGAATVVMISAVIAAIAGDIVKVGDRVELTTVLGVLCVYLLLALFFAGVHQLCSAFSQHYLNGTSNPPSVADLLYFSVITMTTVGFGDITPAGEVARAVTVVEALTGQLYLVSVVAAVIGGWHGRSQPAR